MGARLMAIVAEGDRGRVYLAPTPDMEAVALSAEPKDVPETDLPKKALGFRIQEYGMTRWCDLFTQRQLVALMMFSDLVPQVRERVRNDAQLAGLSEDGIGAKTSAIEYSDAVALYLGLSASKAADNNSTICSWMSGIKYEVVRNTFSRQAIPMTWDYAESNPFAGSSGDFYEQVKRALSVFDISFPTSKVAGRSWQADAQSGVEAVGRVVSTDPPYYDNIGYADLSDFFYIWLRRSLRLVFPELFATLAVPKAEELVATPHRHGSREKAEEFFLNGMTMAMHRLAEQAHPAFPVTIYYAFKQSETGDNGEEGISSTGWDTFLEAVISAGFEVTGTWPMRTERSARSVGNGTNALASSIILVCRSRAGNAATATRREFVAALKSELPTALAHLQRGNIAPVDLAQAAIGPGMGVFTRYTRVVDANGEPVSVRDALALINQTLDEALAEQEGDFDADTRWAVAWFEQSGFEAGEFGVAEILSKAKNTSVAGMVDASFLSSKGGKVRLLRPDELSAVWDPETDTRLTAWEVVHQLIRVLEAGGEAGAAEMVTKLGNKAEAARELAYRLYTICERKKRASQALSYNALVQSWPEITRLAADAAKHILQPQQGEFFN